MPQLKEGDLLNGHYRLLQRVGQGGFSVVWMAADERIRQAKVAVKVFVPAQGLDPASLQVFRLEHDLTKPLLDARLLKATDYFEHEESPCLVFPFMHNGSLAARISAGHVFSEMELAKLMYQVGGALDYLHSRSPSPILHLDVKPENILINYAGEYLLSDFGISQQLRNTMLRASQLKGESLMYRSPERILNQGMGPGVDIFSFGVSLLECVNGLFDRDYSPGYAVLSGAPLPPAQVGGARLQQWIHACLNQDPADRPTARELAQAADFFISNQFWPEAPKLTRPQKGPRETERLERENIPPPPPPPPYTPPIDPLPVPERKRKGDTVLWVFTTLAVVAMLSVAGYYYYRVLEENEATVEMTEEAVAPEPVKQEEIRAKVVTNGSLLMLRNKPNQYADIVAKMPNESRVKILEFVGDYEYIEGERGKWCVVEYEGVTGYAFAAFLQKID